MDAELSETAGIYDRVAEDYQRWWAPVIEPAALRLLDLVADVVADRPGALVVDIGAGTGTLARRAIARWPSARAIAVDPSRGMLAVGRAEAQRTLASADADRLTWTLGVAEQLPIPDQSADAVVSSFALQYLPSRTAGLREAQRILRPGGALALVTWLANDWPFEPWKAFGTLLRELSLTRPGPEEVYRPFTSLPSAAALVRRCGFREVHAIDGLVEHRWRPDDLVACTIQCEERALFDSLDGPTRTRLELLWRERLARLGPADFLYRDRVCYVIGRRRAR